MFRDSNVRVDMAVDVYINDVVFEHAVFCIQARLQNPERIVLESCDLQSCPRIEASGQCYIWNECYSCMCVTLLQCLGGGC